MSSATKKVESEADAGYPIRTVSALTGVNAFTLRTWERRYGFLEPARTPSGQRVYTPRHIDAIKRVLALLDSGMAIGQVAGILANAGLDSPAGHGDGPWLDLRRRTFDAIIDFDEQNLEAAYQEALSVHPVEQVTERLLLPLLEELGTRWLDSAVGVAEEHFFSAYLRNKLGARFHHRRKPQQGPQLLCACFPGERHELGLLLFALAAHDRGYRTVMLGGDMPLEALAAAASRLRPEAVVLSAFVDPGQKVWEQGLGELVGAVKAPVFVGGPVSLTHHKAIGNVGAHALGCDFGLAFRRMGEVIKDQKTRGDD